jgi:Fe-S oxidoreductase
MNFDAKSLRQCIYCHNFCKFCCAPYLATKNQKVIQTQKNYLIYLVNENKIEPNAELGKAVYLCNDCKRCETYCIFEGKNVLPNNRYAKNLIFKNMLAPKKVYDIYNHLLNFGNFLGKKTRQSAVKDFDKNKRYDFLVYPGDYVNLLAPNITKSFIKILKKLNKSFILCDDIEVSDGAIALDLGMEELAEELMERNFRKVTQYKFDALIVLNPYSYYCFKNDYGKYGFKFDFEIIHYIDFMERHIDNLKIKKTNDYVKYFDPCVLSRWIKINESPRNILRVLCNNQDFDLIKNREESECCGGNLSLIFPEISRIITEGLLNEIKSYYEKTEVLITACPLCLSNLLKAQNSSRFKIYDLIEYISNNMV